MSFIISCLLTDLSIYICRSLIAHLIKRIAQWLNSLAERIEQVYSVAIGFWFVSTRIDNEDLHLQMKLQTLTYSNWTIYVTPMAIMVSLAWCLWVWDACFGKCAFLCHPIGMEIKYLMAHDEAASRHCLSIWDLCLILSFRVRVQVRSQLTENVILLPICLICAIEVIIYRIRYSMLF